MLTTPQLLEAASAAQGGATDWRLSRLLGVSASALTNYRGGRTPADDVAFALAKMSGLDAGYVLASMAAERAQDPDLKRVWLELALQRLPACEGADSGSLSLMSSPLAAPRRARALRALARDLRTRSTQCRCPGDAPHLAAA